MLTMPNLRGADALRQLLDDVPAELHAELLGVTARTLRRWLAGSHEIPRCAFHALYWHTRWGASEIEYRFGYENSILRLRLSGAAGHVGGKHLEVAANSSGRALHLVAG